MKVDLCIFNADVFTQDPFKPSAQAVAVSGNKIFKVGSNQELKAFCSSNTKAIDAHGQTLLPGINDAHFHLGKGAFLEADCDLTGGVNLEQLCGILQAAPKRGDWIVGQKLPYSITPNGSNITRHDLDKICTTQPILVFSSDEHIAWANTEALNRAGLLSGGVAGPNSEIVMGADGLATGELREPGAYLSVRNLVPPLSFNRQRSLLVNALKVCARAGITSVQNMDGDDEQFEIFADLECQGELSCRVLFPIKMRPNYPIDTMDQALSWKSRVSGEILRVGMVKFLLDGVIEGQTAYMLDPYPGLPSIRGEPNYSSELFWEMACHADRLGYQIAVHAIGDASVRMALDTYGKLPSVNGLRERRHRIEHIEALDSADIARFKEFGVIASMQPLHAPLTKPDDIWATNLGQERLNKAFRWREILEAGGLLAFGSDWPVVSMNPFNGMHSAMARQPYSQSCQEQALTFEQALNAYTVGSAIAEFQEQHKGRVQEGMLADLIVLDRKLSLNDPVGLEGAQVMHTIMNGKLIYSR